jgi:surface polysaccharide O-acyltransferase-like enzyme
MQAETPNQSASRYLWADFVRNIGILLVILGHVSGMVAVRWGSVPFADWMAGNIYNVIARACVPLLFMVSGALLLPRQESIRDFYRKRFQKVIFPFLFWSVLYLVYKGNGFPGISLPIIVKGVVMTILSRPAEYHLWFMYELFGIYLLTPIFRVLVASTREEHLWYFIGIWFVFGPFQRLLEYLLDFQFIFKLGYLTGYIGYFMLGYLLARIPLKKWMLWTAAVVYLASAVFTGYITLYYTVIADKLVDYFQYLLGINIVFLSASAFILLKAAGEAIFPAPNAGRCGGAVPRPRLAKWAVGLTSASFGMYLVHVFVLNFLRQNSLGPLDGSSIYMVPLTTILVFIISWVVIAILQKIPFLRSLVA